MPEQVIQVVLRDLKGIERKTDLAVKAVLTAMTTDDTDIIIREVIGLDQETTIVAMRKTTLVGEKIREEGTRGLRKVIETEDDLAMEEIEKTGKIQETEGTNNLRGEKEIQRRSLRKRQMCLKCYQKSALKTLSLQT